jgi:reductive dehalogenase
MNEPRFETGEKPSNDPGKMKEANNFKSPLTDLIDDKEYGRFDKRKSSMYYDQYFKEGHQVRLRAKAHKKMIQGIQRNAPGQTLKDVALHSAAKSVRASVHSPKAGTGQKDAERLGGSAPQLCFGPNVPNAGLRSWLPFNDSLPTPERLAVPRFSGSPQEASLIVKQAGIQFGAARVGITGLDKRHIYSRDCDGKEIVFEEIDQPYETEGKRVIPEKCRYVIVFLLHMPYDAFNCAPHPVCSMVPMFTYSRIDLLLGHMAEFIRALGYTAIPSANDTAPNGPFAIEAGLGEQCRADKVINPDLGTMVRLCKIITDLPLQLDQPQKFGIEDFCKVCDRCIEACPVNAISKDREASFERPGEWVNPGHKTWHGKWPTCWAYAESTGGGCGICLPVCPWNKPNTFLFRMVKAVVRRTTLFNRLLVKLDKMLGYGKPLSPEEWWRKKISTYGIDTRQ